MERNLAAVKAVLATVNGRIVDDSSSENKKELTLDGYNTWVYLKWRAENKAWVVTGYKENDKHSSVDDRQRAMNLAESYALNTFGGLERVGAALEYSIARVAREYKQNNANPFLKLDFSASMARVTQRSMELLEARGEEEVAQDIMADMRAACERLSVVLADDDVDARRGTGLKVYAEMQALMSAVRAALPEKYLRQGNLDMLLRWASAYAQMAQNGNVPARGTIKGKAFDMFVDALQRQAERDRLQGMTEEEAREVLMEIASDKLETAFLKVARDSVRRLDQFLKDRALERIEWLYTHAYPTREDSKTKALVKKNVLIALHVGVTSSTDRKLIVSKIASAYGKNHIRTIINKHKILYWNDQKGKVMLNDYRLQLPQAVAHDLATGNM